MTDVTPETFDAEITKAATSVLVEFWAPWCGPCHTMKPILKEFAESEKDRVKVALINAQDHPDLANRFGVMAIPTFFVFRDGAVTGQHVGTLDRAGLARLAGVAT